MLAAGLCVVLLAFVGCSSNDEAGPVRLTWYASDESGSPFKSVADRCSQESNGRYQIDLALLPKDADQQRELLVRRLAAEDSSVDLMVMDVIWVPEFASAGWIEPWEGEAADTATRGRLPSAVESATFQGGVWASPFTGNAQMLWYRTDRAPEAPNTWDEMLTQGEELQGGDGGGLVQGQGARYEGLVVLFNSLLESAGGHILDEAGTGPSLEEEPTRRALEIMRRWGSSPAAPAGLSTAKEDDARLAFEAGDSAFEVNYSFVWSSAQEKAPEIAQVMAYAPWPSVYEGQPAHVTYGGFNIGVGAYSKHTEEAFAAAACLSNEASQKQIQSLSGLPPTAQALYDDPEVRERLPYADLLRATLAEASLRPLTPAYNDISLALQRELHPMRDIDPDNDVDDLRDAVDRALESKGLL
jgi:multiple sugar transport system substrate-binding protein